MVYVVSPEWFYGIDYLFDSVSVIVALLITFFSYKSYKYTSQKKYLYFALSLFLVAAAFLAKILATIPIYSRQLKVETIGLVTVTSQVISKVTWINQFGVSIGRFLMLIAFLILIIITLKLADKKIIGLLIYFLVISTTLVSASYEVFHLTLLIMVTLLFMNYRHNFLKIKSKNSKLVMLTFFCLMISQFFFFGAGFISNLYVIGESIQLVGYLILLGAFVKIVTKK